MNFLRNWLFGSENNILKKSAVWNLISSVEYSLQSAVLMLIITRITGFYEAGIFTIAYTLTQMMATIGSYGMRSFQASDIKKEYTFETYFSSRILSVAAMIVICISYACMQGYDREKIIIIIILCLYRVVDDIEDVFHGEMQKSMRLDVASKILAVRIFIATLVFGIAYVCTKNLIISSMALTISAIIVSIILNAAVVGGFEDIRLKTSKVKLFKLLWVCLPVCLGGYLYNYLVNAPKYAIDRNLTEETQTIFNILFMPIFAINMLSSFVFKPMIVNMGVLWNDSKYDKFIRMVVKQIAFIAGLTAVIMLAGASIGIPILGWMYKARLGEYRNFFAVLILFGGVAALVAFMVVVLTIVRQQRYIIFAYGLAAVIDVLFIDKFVRGYGIWGAGLAYGVAMSIVMLILIVVLIITLHRRKVSKDDKINV